MFGIGQTASAIRRRGGAVATQKRRRAKWLRAIGVAASHLFALLLLLISALIHRSSTAPTAPRPS